MEKEGGEPLLRLVPRVGDVPSHVATNPRAARRSQAGAPAESVGVVAPPPPEDRLDYVPNRDKIVEGTLFLLERAALEEIELVPDTIGTIMFLADKGHLDAYGRPVFFDNYAATADGPAGEAATEMLDAAFDWSSIGVEAAPWSSERGRDADRLSGARAPNMRRLSRSDVNALDGAFATVTSLDAGRLRSLTHRQRAYATAWRVGAGTRMDPRLIPEVRDDEAIDGLMYVSRHAFAARPRASERVAFGVVRVEGA